MSKKRQPLQATLNQIKQQEWDEQDTQRKEKGHESQKVHQHEAKQRLVKEGAQQQQEYNCEQRASGACPDPITDPLRWCEYIWSKKDKCESPEWAGDL